MATDLSINQIIHAAVRRDVGRTEQALRAMPDGDGARAREIQRGWGHLVHQLTEHHQQEGALVWPFLQGRGVDQELLDAMESEHQALGEALRNGAGAIADVVADPSAPRARSAADVIAESGGVITGHLDHEERDVEPLIRAQAESPEWKAVERRFREGGVTRGGNMMAWLQDGGSPDAQAALRATIPPPALFVLGRVFGRRYHKEIAPIWR
jgi:hypothetical protein